MSTRQTKRNLRFQAPDEGLIVATKQAESVDLGWAVYNFYTYFATFSGRSSRSEYWYFQLYSLLLGLAILLFMFMPEPLQIAASIVSVLVVFVHIVPGLAVTVRRLRDAGFPPYLAFLLLVPFGGLIILVFAMMPSEPIDLMNPPKEAENIATVTNGNADHSIEGDLSRLDELYSKGLIDEEQLKRAKNKALGI